jgi:hypothetical protein
MGECKRVRSSAPSFCLVLTHSGRQKHRSQGRGLMDEVRSPGLGMRLLGDRPPLGPACGYVAEGLMGKKLKSWRE